MSGQWRSKTWEGGIYLIPKHCSVLISCVVVPVSTKNLSPGCGEDTVTLIRQNQSLKAPVLWSVGLDFFQQALGSHGWQPTLLLDSNKTILSQDLTKIKEMQPLFQGRILI